MIPGLNGLRGIAFLLIFLAHTDSLGFGWAGVQLFFVLSGFLITGILVEMKRAWQGREFFLNFYGRRFFRIVPLYYLYLFLAFLLSIALYKMGAFIKNVEVFWHQLPYVLAFVYNFLTSEESSLLIGHLWTISVEEQFYIFWPLLVFLTPERHLKKLFVVAILTGFLARLALPIVSEAFPLPFFVNGVPLGVYVLTFSHLDAFGMGALLSQQKLPRSTAQFVVLTLALPLLGFAAQYLSTGQMGPLSTLGFPFLMENAFQYVWGYSLLNYWFAVAIDAAAREGLLNRLLDSRPLAYLGKISYGMYVFHTAVIFFIYRFLGRTMTLPAFVMKAALMTLQFAVTLALASLSYRFFEKPLLDLRERYFPGPKAKTPSRAAPISSPSP